MLSTTSRRAAAALLTALTLGLTLPGCGKKHDPEAPTDKEWTYSVGTLAGRLTPGRADGAGTNAAFSRPVGLALDGQGNLYVGDSDNNSIRKVTPGGAVTTLAGSGTSGYGDGTGAAALFSGPAGLAVDGQGTVYVADRNNNCIRKVTAAGAVSTLAGARLSGYRDGTGTAAQFAQPAGVALAADGTLYVADSRNHMIRKITAQGVVSTVAGSGTPGFADGAGLSAQFSNPQALVLDKQGNLLVADTWNYRIRKVTPQGVVTTVAGGNAQGSTDGTGAAARFGYPYGLAIDSRGNVYVSDYANDCVRRITSGGEVSTLTGRVGETDYIDGAAAAARFSGPAGITADGQGQQLYVADSDNNMIRKISGQ